MATNTQTTTAELVAALLSTLNTNGNNTQAISQLATGVSGVTDALGTMKWKHISKITTPAYLPASHVA